MEKIKPQPLPVLFNSLLETGVRSVLILNSAYPRGFGLTEMTWLDYLVVHTGDLGGPDSLHPDLPYRTGELLVRRKLIKDSLDMMRRLHLIEMKPANDGVQYLSSEQAHPFAQLLRTNYNVQLKAATEWLIAYVNKHGLTDIQNRITEQIGKWNVEFQIEHKSAI